LAVNLASKYEKQFEAAFKPTSIFAGKVSDKYNFEGAKKINIYSPVTVPLRDYTRSGGSRYGTPDEMSSVVQTLELTQDKSFTQSLDRGNYTDSQMAISAANWMSEQIKGVVTPATEKHAMTQYFKNAGQVAAASATLTKTNIVGALEAGITAQRNKFVPEDGRYLYLSAKHLGMLSISDEFIKIEKLGEKSVGKGVVGMFMGAQVLPVPDSFFPTGGIALLARKDSLLLPRKISTFKTHSNPPGIDGWLMEGRVYYDAFVIGGKADGVWALCETGKKQATPTAAVSSGNLTLTSANSGGIYYTVNGGDPRYDKDAKAYSSAFAVTSGQVVRAVAYGGSSTPFTSDVLEYTVS